MEIFLQISLVIMVAITSYRAGNNHAYTQGGIRMLDILAKHDKELAMRVAQEAKREAV